MTQAIRQIIIPDNLVFPKKDHGVNLDCSHLATDGVVFIGDDGTTMWVEKEPFTGRITNYDFTEALVLWEQAETMLPTLPEEGDPNQPFVPSAVSRRQGRLALLNVGKLDDVEAAIDAIEDPVQKRAAQIEFEADTWERSNPFLQQLWAQLGGTEQELDDLFRFGATL